MQITDEMVEKASQRFLSNVSPSEMRAALEAVAPLIAKAENEACAGIAGGLRYNAPNGSQTSAAWDRACNKIEVAIRARHATPTPSTPQEK